MEGVLAKTRRIRAKGTMRRRFAGQGLSLGSVKINSDAISAILAPLYNDLPKTIAAGEHNLTYGEVEWPTLKLMLDYAQKQSSHPGRFYDLGSGRGRAVLYMSLTGLFDSSVGIEVLPERVALAKQALVKLRSSIPNAGAKVKLYEASFLNPSFKYKDARLVFLSNMCFDKQTQDAIFGRLAAEMPKGSLVFCSRLPDSSLPAFETVGVERVPMTWTPTSEIHILRHL
uniref:Histone-lysine N-methyltransferase, H3 lysine-79 specific n=1 Tax=viral metagenome TaxID=1070528 RepID=A0A6C0ANE9_9ZZZZ